MLSTGLGVLVVLLVLPGGLGSLWVKLRDVVVRLLTGRRSTNRGASDRRAVDEPGRRRKPQLAARPSHRRRRPERAVNRSRPTSPTR